MCRASIAFALLLALLGCQDTRPAGGADQSVRRPRIVNEIEGLHLNANYRFKQESGKRSLLEWEFVLVVLRAPEPKMTPLVLRDLCLHIGYEFLDDAGQASFWEEKRWISIPVKLGETGVWRGQDWVKTSTALRTDQIELSTLLEWSTHCPISPQVGVSPVNTTQSPPSSAQVP
jgi:hypothetical protein